MTQREKHLYEFGAFRLSPDEHLLTHEGQPVRLPLKAFELLLFLVQHSNQVIDKEILMQEDLSKEELDSIAFGEIGGVLIPRRNQKRRQLDLYRYLAEGWTGINEEQLLRLAQTARERGTPGIVVLVFESDLKKAEFTCELLRRGFINHLVGSAELIEKLKQLP